MRGERKKLTFKLQVQGIILTKGEEDPTSPSFLHDLEARDGDVWRVEDEV